MNIRVLGLGNVLMSDDAFGPYVVRVLEGMYEMPPNVQVVDAARPGLDLVPYLVGADVVILIDTVGACGRPGEIHSYRLDDLIAESPEPRLCPHDPGIRVALLAAAAQGRAPRHVLLFGVVPEWEATGATLSRAVHDAIAPIVGLVMRELERLGAAPRLRATFHRAFDALPDPSRAIAALKQHAQIDRILSGGEPGNWDERCRRLSSLSEIAQPEIQILPGGGVDLEAVRRIAATPMLAEAHVGRAVRVPREVWGRVSADLVATLAAVSPDPPSPCSV
jgi:hydrogenase maturation protease